MLKEFLEFAKAYKELALLITSIVLGIFFVRDYFATKAEVEVLRCQADNGIAIIESRINSDHLTQQIISLKKEIADGESKLKAAKVNNATGSEWLISLNLQIEQLRKELDRQDGIRSMAAEKLKPGACEESVRR